MSKLVFSEHTPSLTASFRDPAGSLFGFHGRALRVVNRVGIADLEASLASPSSRKPMTGGGVVRSRELDGAERNHPLDDPALRELYQARGREELHQDLTVDLFESLRRRHFDIVRVQYEEGATRWLYLLLRR